MEDVKYLIESGVDVKKSLELFGDIKTYNETLEEYVLSITDKLNKLEDYKNKKNMKNYSMYAHSIKADSKYFGFNDLADVATCHESRSKVGDMQYIEENFSIFQEKIKQAIKICTTYLKKETVEETIKVNANKEVYTQNTVLIVDDSSIIRRFVTQILEGSYNIGTATNGQEAIDIIASNIDNNNICCILLDINMPGVNGFDVLEYMNKNNLFQKIPVSIVSGDSSKKTINKAFKYPIIDMLAKPFTSNDIKKILNKTLMYKEMNEMK